MRGRRDLPLVIAATAAALVAFMAVSARLEIAHRGHGLGPRPAPPLYGVWHPRSVAAIALAGAIAVAIAVLAYLLLRRPRSYGIAAPAAALALMLGFAASVAAIDGWPQEAISPLVRERPPDYQVDVHLVHERGVRRFVGEHPTLVHGFGSVHSISHPPGPLVLLAALESAAPRRALPRAVALAAMTALMLGAAWATARRVGSSRAALVAVALLAVAPAPVLYAFTSLDGVFAAALAACMALSVAAFAEEGRWRLAFAAGAAIGAATFLTYAVVFVCVAAVIIASTRQRPAEAARSLGVAAAGGVIALAVMWAVLGFDLLASYGATYEHLRAITGDRSPLYWLAGNPASWMIFAGMPIAALATWEVLTRRAWYVLALLLPLAVFYALPVSISHIIPAELERTLMFGYPVAAAAAGVSFTRWEERTGGSRPAAAAALVLLTGAQTVAMESLIDIPW